MQNAQSHYYTVVTPFVHLHNHSDFSLLKGAAAVTELAATAAKLSQQAIAITDDGNLFGALSFFKACEQNGVQPIIGCDLFVAPADRHRRGNEDGPNRNGRLVLLAQNETGYHNLMRLSSLGYTEGFYYKPRVDHELLRTYHEGLIALTGSINGEVPRLLLANQHEQARAVLTTYRDIYGEQNVYVELVDNGIPDQRALRQMLIELADELSLPLVAANDTYYVAKEDANAQDILMCIGGNKKRDEANRFRFSTQEFYLKSGDEMAALFADRPEAIANSVAIAERCAFELKLPGPSFPAYAPPAGKGDGPTYLRHLTDAGLHERYEHIDDAIRQRAELELNTIIELGFTEYFLIVWDFIAFARGRDIPVGPGRGSGAGSIVAYALKITDIDPLQYGLLFERFLNRDRVSLPDFDIDFCYERRGEVIDYVTERYGRDKVGQIITFGTLKAKAVIRDVARVLGLDFDEADAIAKLVPSDLKITIDTALEQEPELNKLAERGGVYTELIDVSRRLENKHRHASTHAAGIVIGERPLVDYVPLYRDPRTGQISTQYTMEQLEDCGLVKMDFLGLKTLTLIRNTEQLVRERVPEFAIDRVAEDDEATFRMLGRGESLAVFQFESSGMQDILTRAKPGRIEDLIALNALYRPGPMQFIDQFVDAKSGRTPIRYPLPALEAVLEETYGVIVYQEQVMQIVQIVAGFSLGQADILRRAMGKKKKAIMAEMKTDFIEGAAARDYSTEQASEIFELLEPFAGYGFNKSHAAAYSLLAYHTAYLKANYPVEFMAANLSNEIANSDKFAEYLDEARRMGIAVRPPHINSSGKQFRADADEIVFGLAGVKNVGSAAVDHILSVRDSEGQFTSLLDFAERIDGRAVNRKVIETLVKVGAFDGLGHNRATLIANLDTLLEAAARTRESRESGQASLFGDEMSGDEQLAIEHLPEWAATERLTHERELLGFYFSGHPLDDYRDRWRKSTTLNLSRLAGAERGTEQVLVAFLSKFRSIVTKKGTRMAVGRLSDYNGEVEMVVFPPVYAEVADAIEPNSVVGCTGVLEDRGGSAQFVVAGFHQLDELAEKPAAEVHLRLASDCSDETQLAELRAELSQVRGDSELYLHIGTNGSETIVRAGDQLRLASSPEALGRVQQHPLIAEVWSE